MIRLYIANLGKYNKGELVGAWLTLPLAYDEDDFKQEFQEFLESQVGINEEYEEFAIHDYETDLEMEIGEYDNVAHLNELAAKIEDIREYDMNAFKALIEAENIDTALELIESRDFTFYEDINTHEELGYYIVEEGLFGVEIPSALANYIDHEAIGRDWSMDMTETSYGYIQIF